MKTQQKYPNEKILEMWNQQKDNLQVGKENEEVLENMFLSIQKEINYLTARLSMLMNSIRLIKTQDTCQLRDNPKEFYMYTDDTGAEITVSREDVIEELKIVAKQAKLARFPIKETTQKSIIMSVDSINKVILTPGQYLVRVLGIYWDPNFNNRTRRIKYIMETETGDLFSINLYKNKEFEYYSPAKQKDIELKSPDMWLQPLVITVGISPTTTFLTLDSIEIVDKKWFEADVNNEKKEINNNEFTNI